METCQYPQTSSLFLFRALKHSVAHPPAFSIGSELYDRQNSHTPHLPGPETVLPDSETAAFSHPTVGNPLPLPKMAHCTEGLSSGAFAPLLGSWQQVKVLDEERGCFQKQKWANAWGLGVGKGQRKTFKDKLVSQRWPDHAAASPTCPLLSPASPFSIANTFQTQCLGLC